MSRWISNFQQANPNVRINYQSIGSGGGIQQLKKGLVDFGASDAALSDEQLKDMPPLVQIPESAGPVCITCNISNLKEPLKLSPATLAGIYLGKIKNWRDPAIAKDNPGVRLPSAEIVVTHRTENSGTKQYIHHVSRCCESRLAQQGRQRSVRELACRLGRQRQ